MSTVHDQGLKERSDIRIVVVVHGTPDDPFWSVVNNAVEIAQSDFGVQVEYRAPDTFDMVLMAQLIDAAVASNPDALIVSVPDAAALGDSIGGAVEAGIPVFSINSGSDVFQELGILRHIGQTEYEAGLGGGKRMKALGGTNGLCINHQVGNVALDLRCEGFADGLEGTVEVLAVSQDPIEIQNAVTAALQASPDIDTILATGPLGGNPTLEALREAGLAGDMLFGVFDLGPDLLQGAVEGEVSFLIDQQQFLQGYLGVQTAVNYVQFSVLPGNEVILTGPGFVTPDNAADVINLSAEGFR
ncbi:MAG: sugar ABC transporter substrate-binding protein [Trueperaceae bacterium]|nr:MAG: sugar ABC transporter substrate-binding protein [Trueperaceae bacterium]